MTPGKRHASEYRGCLWSDPRAGDGRGNVIRIRGVLALEHRYATFEDGVGDLANLAQDFVTSVSAGV